MKINLIMEYDIDINGAVEAMWDALFEYVSADLPEGVLDNDYVHMQLMKAVYEEL